MSVFSYATSEPEEIVSLVRAILLVGQAQRVGGWSPGEASPTAIQRVR
jgi:hypothetical protein